ncbi:MAG: hypothetical protein PF542_02715 [Nanoarchaeota archaeon]|jgi:hypothetical protein|nr:hypothetical protein [Nanoarchaeota archaeon]
MKLFKKKCDYCGQRIDKGKEFFKEVKVPEFIDPKIKTFCSKEHFEEYLMRNHGTKSRKPYCLNCDD